MVFEGLICPVCSMQLEEKLLQDTLLCPQCGINLKQKRFLAFLEFLMMQGIVTNIDFFDQTLYGDEIKKSDEGKELKDETDPNEYEDITEKMAYFDETHDLHEATTNEEEFRAWEGLEEDWEEFNRRESKGKKWKSE